MGLFENRNMNNQNQTIIPTWFMRQAGRYHSHYQGFRKKYDFMTMCKNPILAAEITMGPIDDFKFDAAILFSDLLFPLENLGMGLSYQSGPPTLELKIEDNEALKKIKVMQNGDTYYGFQKDALKILKEQLDPNKTLHGFVGAPFTLYTYAVEGGHSGALLNSKKGLYDGRFNAFMEHLLPQIEQSMDAQAEGGADSICIFDTACGEFTVEDFLEYNLPHIKYLTKRFKEKYPNKKILYYSKFTHINYLKEIRDENIDALGIDWRMDLRTALLELAPQYYIQGNIDPCYLHLPWEQLERKLNHMKMNLLDLPREILSKYIFSLGHGVLQHTPEINVRNTVEWAHKNLVY